MVSEQYYGAKIDLLAFTQYRASSLLKNNNVNNETFCIIFFSVCTFDISSCSVFRSKDDFPNHQLSYVVLRFENKSATFLLVRTSAVIQVPLLRPFCTDLDAQDRPACSSMAASDGDTPRDSAA